MQMIRHIVYGDQFLPLTGNDTGNVLLEFVVVLGFDETLPPFNRENNVDIDLRVGICHGCSNVAPTELGVIFESEIYKYVAPTALVASSFNLLETVMPVVSPRDAGATLNLHPFP